MGSDGALLWDFLVCRCVSPHPHPCMLFLCFLFGFLKVCFILLDFCFGLFALVSCGFGWVGGWGGGEELRERKP